MKRLCLVAIFLVIGIALAQDTNRHESNASSPGQTETQTQNGTLAQTRKVGAAAVQTQSYKGTLVDASCAMSGMEAAATTTVSSGGSQKTTDSAESKEHNKEANLSARSDKGQACSVSANTNQFALKLDTGRTVRFDSVGNVRAQEAIKDKKKWIEGAASGKAIHIKVSGVMTGDKLTVMSIN